MLFKATQFTVVTGYSVGHMALNAFDNPLQNSCVGNYNLVKVSSSLPPLCKESTIIEVPLAIVMSVTYCDCISVGNPG